MRAVVQRVISASVSVDGTVKGRIGQGLLVLVAVAKGDTRRDAAYLAGKTAGLRVFEGEDHRMTRSVRDVGGAVLAISQFTLFGDVRRGLRPSFDRAAPPGPAEELYEAYVSELQDMGVEVSTGVFRAMMEVKSTNQGPVTILIDSEKKF